MNTTPESLNNAQREAVEHGFTPQAVLAGPGTGKTRVITRRVADLIERRGVRGESIVAVTFSVKAAEELRSRLHELIGAKAASIQTHTFHSLGLSILRRFPDEAALPRRSLGTNLIADSAQRRRLLREVLIKERLFPTARGLGIDSAVEHVEHHVDAFADQALTPEMVIAFVARAMRGLDAGVATDGTTLDDLGIAAARERLTRLEVTARAVRAFQGAALARGWMSYADLIARPTHLVTTSRRVGSILRDEWRHWVVDEFQDVNRAQIEFLRALVPPVHAPHPPPHFARSSDATETSHGVRGPDLTVVGDDDQAIYAFRGADEQAFARFQSIWQGATVRRLTTNYRSTASIVRVSQRIISRAHLRFDVAKLIASGAEGPSARVELVHLQDEPSDADVICAMILMDMRSRQGATWDDYAVVARSHPDVARVAGALELEGVPVRVAREPSVLDDEGVQRVMAMVTLVVSPEQSHAAMRLLLRPPLSMPLEEARALSRLHREATYAAQRGEKTVPTFVDWLRTQEQAGPAATKLIAWRDEIAALDAEQTAEKTITRIVTLIDAVHADLLPARERARRVTSVVEFLKFVSERVTRLEPPGDLRAFDAYCRDLNDDDFRASGESRSLLEESGVDDRQASSGGVRLVTAHSSKGLEFDTVFVPRVSPAHGYPTTRGGSDEGLLPPGLVDQLGDSRSPKERAIDEERRVFYVASTRAERRLVLLAKKTKSLSSSTHFFQELLHDPEVAGDIEVTDEQAVYRSAAKLNVGTPNARWRDESSDSSGAVQSGSARTRAEILAQAAQRARAAAALAMDAAELTPDASARAAQAAGEAALCLSMIARVRATGAMPEVTPSTPPAVRACLEQLRATLAAAVDAPDGARETGSAESAWERLVAAQTPRGKLHLSYSQISTFLRCPRCYFVRYVLGMPEPTSDAASVGTVVHESLKRFNLLLREAEADGRTPPDESVLLRIAREEFEGAAGDLADASPATLEQVMIQLRTAASMHEAGANILEVEKSLELKFGEHRVTCQTDRIDEITGADGQPLLRVVDYKTGTPTKAKLKPEKTDLQLCLYAMGARELFGDEQRDGQAEYWVLATGERGILRFSDMKLDKVRLTVSDVIESILAGRFERKGGDRIAHACDLLASLGV